MRAGRRPGDRWRRAALGGLLGLATVAGGSAARALPGPPAVADSLALPLGRTTGIAWLPEDRFAVLTRATEGPGVTLSLLDRQARVVRRQDVTGVLARGLAADGEALWSCGDLPDGSSRVYRLDRQTLSVTRVLPAPGHRPCGLAWDGRVLWVADRDAARLFALDPQTGAVLKALPSPGFSPVGLGWDGQRLLVADAGIGGVDAFDPRDGATTPLFRWPGGPNAREPWLAPGPDGLWLAAPRAGEPPPAQAYRVGAP